ncbi:MAG: PadR family transcriptional regulator [Roseiflexaceae bacterium]
MTTLGYALLGVLARGPASGYDLSRQLQAPIGFFWRARHSQIYPELARLESQGHVTHEVVTQQDHPDKKVYTITAEGQAALRQWATEPVDAAVVRDEFLLKTYCLWLADPAAALALFRDHERVHAEQLRVYQDLRQQLEQKGREAISQRDSPWFATYITLRRGIGYEQEYLAWCRWVIELLEQPEQGVV